MAENAVSTLKLSIGKHLHRLLLPRPTTLESLHKIAEKIAKIPTGASFCFFTQENRPILEQSDLDRALSLAKRGILRLRYAPCPLGREHETSNVDEFMSLPCVQETLSHIRNLAKHVNVRTIVQHLVQNAMGVTDFAHQFDVAVQSDSSTVDACVQSTPNSSCSSTQTSTRSEDVGVQFSPKTRDQDMQTAQAEAPIPEEREQTKRESVQDTKSKVSLPPQPRLSCRVIESGIRNGNLKIEASQEFEWYWKLQNIGTLEWPESRILFANGDKLLPFEPIIVPATEVGDSVTVVTKMVAPDQPGRYIAYFSFYGPKLECDISVVKKESGEAIAAWKARRFTVESHPEVETKDAAQGPPIHVTADEAVSPLNGSASDVDGEFVIVDSPEKDRLSFSLFDSGEWKWELEQLAERGYPRSLKNILYLDQTNGNVEAVIAMLKHEADMESSVFTV